MPILARINLQSHTITKEDITSKHPYEMYAGRSLSSKIISNEVDPLCDPLGPENKLIFACGFIGGTPAPNSGRISVGAKSPMTLGIKESNSGGKAPALLSRQDFRGIVFEGISETWVIVVIKEGEITLEDGTNFVGINNYPLMNMLKEKYGDTVGILSIGLAGEKQCINSSIAAMDMEGFPSRHMGRGGLGAVMGSKKIKAIVVYPPAKSMLIYKNKEEFYSIARDWFKTLNETKEVFRKYGTSIGIDTVNHLHALPTQNFRRGSFRGVENINADALDAFVTKNNGKKGVACSPGCAIRCSNILRTANDEHLTSSLEYETMIMNGSNLMIDDIETLGWIDHYCDDNGLDTIETGNCLAVLMEAGKLKWGDRKGVVDLLKGFSKGNPDSLLLGLGCYKLGKKMGIERIPHVKRQGFPAYEPRSFKGMGVTFVTSAMGADHTAGPAIHGRKAYSDKDYGEVYERKNKVMISKELQIFIYIADSTGCCYFVGPDYDSTQKWAKLFNARYGWNRTAEDWIQWAVDGIKMEREFNSRAGLKATDTLPKFMLEEKLEEIEDRKWDITKKELEEIWD
ncbi:MAG: aldehyde ferredoxin oxidoreductase [Candidatus Lokiarchaeota archaeon]|nr:aldehyde ferredoxin oxidoreductase [Candidatus Lokiarchaeota archaeon]